MAYSKQNGDDVRLLTVKQAASRMACSPANVYGLIEKGELAVVQVGARKGYRVDLRDLEAFIGDRKFRFHAPRPALPVKPLKHLRLS